MSLKPIFVPLVQFYLKVQKFIFSIFLSKQNFNWELTTAFSFSSLVLLVSQRNSISIGMFNWELLKAQTQKVPHFISQTPSSLVKFTNKRKTQLLSIDAWSQNSFTTSLCTIELRKNVERKYGVIHHVNNDFW